MDMMLSWNDCGIGKRNWSRTDLSKIYSRFASAWGCAGCREQSVLTVLRGAYGTDAGTEFYAYAKHEAISHIIITSEEIQVEAESDQIEVCKCAQDWFHLIEQEVQDLIYSWNEIAPPLLRGCTLKRSHCHVYLLDSNNKNMPIIWAVRSVLR